MELERLQTFLLFKLRNLAAKNFCAASEGVAGGEGRGQEPRRAGAAAERLP